MEMLAGQGRIPSVADHLFLVGLFSLLDVMMGQPITEVMRQVSLPENVATALNGEPGAMRDALHLAIAVESGTPEQIASAAEQCGLDASSVAHAMIEALAWAHQISATSG